MKKALMQALLQPKNWTFQKFKPKWDSYLYTIQHDGQSWNIEIFHTTSAGKWDWAISLIEKKQNRYGIFS